MFTHKVHIVLAWLIVALLFQPAWIFAQKVKKVLFVIVDGIPADVIERQHTPLLDSIASHGGYARAHVGGKQGDYTQTPTISAVGYNSLLTGTWVNKHNVWDNDIAKPNYNYATIFRLLKDQYPDKKIAVFSTWLDNRTKLIGEGQPGNEQLKMDFAFDGLELDTVRYPHDSLKKYIQRIDEAVTNEAAATIARHAPDLSWVYLEYTDDMGHKFGDSEQFYDAVKQMDRQVGRLYKAVKQRMAESNEDWQVYITTDHGRDSVDGKGHGRQSQRERNTWIVTNAKEVNSYFKEGRGAIVDIMPTIARFMEISIPRRRMMEVDGIPLIGPLSAIDPIVVIRDEKLQVSWKALSDRGYAKVWVATTDNFNSGGEDKYTLMKTVPLSDGNVVIDVSAYKAKLYKIVIETPNNFLNRWAGSDLKTLVEKRK